MNDDAEDARYATDVADALKDLAHFKSSYGNFYITKVSFGFDGEDDDQLAVIADEVGGLSLEVNS